MSAKNKNNKLKGGPNSDQVIGGSTDDFVDGKSGDDVVGGSSGSDWVKGGSGDDVLRFNFAENLASYNRYDGGSGVDALLLELSFDEWMQLDVQQDVADYLAWLPLQLNKRGIATGQGTFEFESTSLDVRKVESLRVEVGGVEISPEDDPVELEADAYTASEDQRSITGNVLLNDVVPDLVRSVEIVEGPDRGTAVISVSGEFTYTYDELFEYLAVGESADVIFSYRVQDADLDDDITQVTLTITGVNDAPIALDDTATVDEDSTIAVDVMANDSDIDATDSFFISRVDQSIKGGVASIVDGKILFDSNGDFDYLAVNESESLVLRYQIEDIHGATDEAELSVTVTGVNDAPVALDDTATIDENSVVTVDVMDNDSDIDTTDTFSVSRVDQSAKGGIASVVDSSILFDTNGDFESLAKGETEEVVLRYEIEDIHGATDEAELTVTVTGVNDAPIARLDDASATESGNVLIDVLSNDSDVDNDAQLTVVDVSVVYGGGTASIENNRVRFDTNGQFEHLGAGQQDEAIIEYTMRDEHGATSTSAAFVTISGEYDAPTMVETLGSLGAMTADYASVWHSYRLAETGKASTLNFGSVSNPSSWNSNWQMGFSDQSIFGLNKNGLRAEAPAAGFSINPGRSDVFSISAEVLGTGASASAWVDPYFSMSMTPYVDVDGGKVNVTHAIDALINSLSTDSNGYYKINTGASASSNNNITLDMPDAYSAGIEMDIAAKLAYGVDVSGTIAGIELGSWNSSGDLFDVTETVDLLGASIDTKEGNLVLTMLDQDIALKGITLPRGIGSVEFFDESNEFITPTQSSGLESSTSVTQPVTGLRLDIDDLLGNLPKVGKVFAALDDKKSYGVPDLGTIYFDYTVLGAGFSLGLGLSSEARTNSQFTVDLLFEKPVYVEGFSDPVMALRNAAWDNLPGIKAVDGGPVSVLPVFNSQLGFSTDLSLNLTGAFDYKIGEVTAGVTLADIIDESFTVGPLASDNNVEIFDLELITVGTVSYGSAGYDQFQGNAFMIG